MFTLDITIFDMVKNLTIIKSRKMELLLKDFYLPNEIFLGLTKAFFYKYVDIISV